MSTEKTNKPSKKKRRPTQQAEQPLLQHEPDRTPVTTSNALIQKFTKAHVAFVRAFCKALQYAKEAGETLLKLQSQTGLKGAALFAFVREQAEVVVSDRSCYLYLRIASRWNELQVVAGDNLTDMSLSQAVKLLQQTKEAKPPQPGKGKDKPALTSDQPKAESVSNAAPNASTNSPVEGGTDAKPQEAPEAEKEKPINVQPPFDQTHKDRLAAVFAENGPAPTPIQLMTNIVIPNLKKVAEVAVSDNDVPFLANALKEALALIEALRQKYAIS
jgi:hypothetical protein